MRPHPRTNLFATIFLAKKNDPQIIRLNGIRGIGIHRGEILPAIAKAALAALLDGNVLVGLHVLWENRRKQTEIHDVPE